MRFLKLGRNMLSACFIASTSFAAGGGGYIEDFDFSFEGPLGTYDQTQLQRGLKVYTEVCSSCHGLKYVPLRTLADEDGLGYSDEQVRAYAEYYEIFDPELDDYRPAVPADHFPEVICNLGSIIASSTCLKPATESGPTWRYASRIL